MEKTLENQWFLFNRDMILFNITKVLFLDIDGVCNCSDTFKKPHNVHFPIDPYLAFLVGKIQLETNCLVVLSSSWRHHKESVEYINDRIVKIYDITGNEPYDDSLPPGAENCQRGREIKAWLDSHQNIDRYAILDDSNDMLPEQQDNFFKTSWSNGISDDICQKVINHLNNN